MAGNVKTKAQRDVALVPSRLIPVVDVARQNECFWPMPQVPNLGQVRTPCPRLSRDSKRRVNKIKDVLQHGYYCNRKS